MLIKADALIAGPDACFTPGCLRVEGNRVAETGTSLSASGEPVIDLSSPGCFTLIVPGFIDGHCHLELSGLAGKIRFRKNQSLLSWLMKILLYRPRRTATHDRWVKRGVALGLAGGNTTVADISADNRSWKTLLRFPIRKICYAEVLGFGPRGDRALGDLRRRMADMPPQRDGFWKGISPHAPYSTDRRVYAQALDLARRHHWRTMTHLAEDPDEVEFVRTGRGPWRTLLRALGRWDPRFVPDARSPVAWAEQIGILKTPTILAHVNYLDDDDLRLLAEGQASVAYCPLAHRYFHHPPHRYRDMIDAGVNVVLGSDSLACSPSLSVLDQMKFVHQAGGLTPEKILALATTNPARALGLDHQLGALEKNKFADCVVLVADRKTSRNPIAAVFAPGTTVGAVMIDGRFVIPPAN